MLTSRQAHVLQHVTTSYIASARPVASASIAKQLGVSSATVRNELASLEEAGYLHQAHTSAGRTPTLRGYYAYARQFIPPEDLPELQRQMLEQQLSQQLGAQLLQELVNVVASLSGYAVVVSLPDNPHMHALHVHLSLLSDSRLLALVVLENGIIRQIFAPLSPAPSDDEVKSVEDNLQDLALPIAEIPAALTVMAEHAELGVRRTLTALLEAWHQLSPPTTFSQGLSHLLREPESQDPQFLHQVGRLIEQPQRAFNSSEGAEGLQVASVAEDGLTLSLEPQLASVQSQLQLGSSYADLLLVGPLRMRYAESLMIARAVQEVCQEI